MLIVATFACLFGIQDLAVTPVVGVVGEPFVLAVTHEGRPMGGLAIEVATPSGVRVAAGATAPDGRLAYVPAAAGAHAFVAHVAGVRCIATFQAAPARRVWMLAFGSVPLGLALLWLHVRGAGRQRR